MKNQCWVSGLVFIWATACAPKLAPMDPSRPIETKGGFKQGGVPIAPDSMLDVLESKPVSASDAKRAKTLGVISTVLAAAGGALIGYPLGQKLGGHEEPNWTLAYIGAGTVAVALPLGIWGGSSLNSAVKAHNRSLGASEPEALGLPRLRVSRIATPLPALRLEHFGLHAKGDSICYLEAGSPLRRVPLAD